MKSVGSRKRVLPKRTLIGFVVVIVLTYSAFNVVDYFHSKEIERKLIGKWSNEVVRDDATLYTFVWEFRADHTLDIYEQGKPNSGSFSVDDYFQWKVSGGELIISWDHHFTREATASQRMNQVISWLTPNLSGNKPPAYYSNRILIDDLKQEIASFRRHPDTKAQEAFVQESFSLSRMKDSD